MATNQELYDLAKARGDALGMRNANDAENQLRNANGEAAQFANKDIATVAQQTKSANQATQPASAYSYTDLTDQIDNTYNAYLKQQLDALTAQETKIEPTYAAARNNAAVTQSQNQNAFNEYANANGLNVGAGGQAALSRQNVYGNAINAADVAQANAYSDIALQKSTVQSDVDSQRSQALYDELVRLDNASREQNQFDASLLANQQSDALSQQRYEQERQQGLADTEYSRMTKLAETMAAYGDFTGYENMGIDTTQMKAAYAQQQALARQKSTSGGSATASKPTLTYAQMIDAIEKENYTPAVLAAYQYYMGEALGGDTQAPAPTTGSNGNITSPTYSKVWGLVRNMSKDKVVPYLTNAYANGQITDAEIDIILDQLGM